ncbi:hypothetical protein ACIBG5_13145 [Kribbella sp. NPDC050241]
MPTRRTSLDAAPGGAVPSGCSSVRRAPARVGKVFYRQVQPGLTEATLK